MMNFTEAMGSGLVFSACNNPFTHCNLIPEVSFSGRMLYPFVLAFSRHSGFLGNELDMTTIVESMCFNEQVKTLGTKKMTPSIPGAGEDLTCRWAIENLGK
jgi:hypothetical protein